VFEVVCEVMKTWVSLANKVMSNWAYNPTTSLITFTCHAHHLLYALLPVFLGLVAYFAPASAGSDCLKLFKENSAYPTGSSLKLLPVFLKSIITKHPLKTWHLLVPQAPEKQSISTLYFPPVEVYSYLLNLYCSITLFLKLPKISKLAFVACPPFPHVPHYTHIINTQQHTHNTHHTVFLSPHPIFS